MKIAYLFTLSILAVFISCPSFAQQELVTFPQSPYLVGHPNPALADVNCLYINVILRGAFSDPNLWLPSEIETQIKGIFRDSGIDIIDTAVDASSSMAKVLKRRIDPNSVRNLRFHPADVPEFRVEIDLLNLDNANQTIFRLQSSLAKKVILEDIPKANIKADVWTDEPVMHLAASKDVEDSVISVAVGQAQAFIKSWSKARTTHNRNEVNRAHLQSRKLPERERIKTEQQQVIEQKFVASKNSKVFHKPDCPFAQQIAPKNLVGYVSREEAIAAGKRPCKRCNP